jgi:hypothetical protein
MSPIVSLDALAKRKIPAPARNKKVHHNISAHIFLSSQSIFPVLSITSTSFLRLLYAFPIVHETQQRECVCVCVCVCIRVRACLCVDQCNWWHCAALVRTLPTVLKPISIYCSAIYKTYYFFSMTPKAAEQSSHTAWTRTGFEEQGINTWYWQHVSPAE